MKESELNLEKTSKTATDGAEVAQVEGEDKHSEEKEIEVGGEGGGVERRTSLPDDETDDDMQERIFGNESNRDEEEEMDQDYAENKISLSDQGEEDVDLESLMQDDSEDMQKMLMTLTVSLVQEALEVSQASMEEMMMMMMLLMMMMVAP